jgi:hypothetical protein
MSTLIGSLGSDWLKKIGIRAPNDEQIRAWRDFLEASIQRDLGLDVDLAIGETTRFQFLGGSDTHTVVEIESFARKALDRFLNRPDAPVVEPRRSGRKRG